MTNYTNNTIRHCLNHYLNPLHVYCRLIDMSMNKQTALRIAGIYEYLYNMVMV